MATAVTVKDIQFEQESDDQAKACLCVAVASDDHDMDFSLSFPLNNQPGMVDFALEEGRLRLITLFETALATLRQGALHRS